MKTKSFFLLIVAACTFYYSLNAQSFMVNLKVFLEGPYSNNSSMICPDPSLIPLSQPYRNAPWNYQGSEQVTVLPSTGIIDWVLVELRETPGDALTAYPDNVIARQAGFLLNNGVITSTDGESYLAFNAEFSYKLYAVIYHRNHIPILAAKELEFNDEVYSYDFTIGSQQIFGDNLGSNVFIDGNHGMIAGDGNSDGQITVSDKISVWKTQSGSTGYLQGDFDLNGQVNNIDRINFWTPNSGKSSQVVGYWKCKDPFVDLRDGQIYNTIDIGDQCWMTQNMNIGTMLTDVQQTNNGLVEKFCYDNDPVNCETYGGLYIWDEAMQYNPANNRGICPPGWRFASDQDFKILEGRVDSHYGIGDPEWDKTSWRGYDAGWKLKEAGNIHWAAPNSGSTNSSGFTALPGGYRGAVLGGYSNLGIGAQFWTSTEEATGAAWVRYLDNNSSAVIRSGSWKSNSQSVRCVRSSYNLSPEIPSMPVPEDEAKNQSLGTGLSWLCSDPENDPLTYDVYFGTTNPPALTITGLTESTYKPVNFNYNTPYYWKVKAYDGHGNSSESPVWSFSIIAEPAFQCGQAVTDERDGQIYSTILIGTQCWMGENMKVGSMITGVTAEHNGINEKYCYNNDPANCDIYGGLYNWNEAMQYNSAGNSQGICPAGWHIATDNEWKILEGSVDSQYGVGDPIWDLTTWRGFDAGGNLKEAGFEHWNEPNTGATNTSGFTALPGGYRGGDFLTIGIQAEFWTSSEETTDGAWIRALTNLGKAVIRAGSWKTNSFSIRCLKN